MKRLDLDPNINIETSSNILDPVTFQPGKMRDIILISQIGDIGHQMEFE